MATAEVEVGAAHEPFPKLSDTMTKPAAGAVMSARPVSVALLAEKLPAASRAMLVLGKFALDPPLLLLLLELVDVLSSVRPDEMNGILCYTDPPENNFVLSYSNFMPPKKKSTAAIHQDAVKKAAAKYSSAGWSVVKPHTCDNKSKYLIATKKKPKKKHVVLVVGSAKRATKKK